MDASELLFSPEFSQTLKKEGINPQEVVEHHKEGLNEVVKTLEDAGIKDKKMVGYVVGMLSAYAYTHGVISVAPFAAMSNKDFVEKMKKELGEERTQQLLKTVKKLAPVKWDEGVAIRTLIQQSIKLKNGIVDPKAAKTDGAEQSTESKGDGIELGALLEVSGDTVEKINQSIIKKAAQERLKGPSKKSEAQEQAEKAIKKAKELMMVVGDIWQVVRKFGTLDLKKVKVLFITLDKLRENGIDVVSDMVGNITAFEAKDEKKAAEFSQMLKENGIEKVAILPTGKGEGNVTTVDAEDLIKSSENTESERSAQSKTMVSGFIKGEMN